MTSATNPEMVTDWPVSRRAWPVVAFLTSVYALACVDRQVISLLIGPMKADLGINDVEVSILGGVAFVLFHTLMGIPLGRLADRTSRPLLIATGVLFWSAMTAACGMASSFRTLFAARVGVGVGEATLSPAALSMIADYFPPKRLGMAASVYLTGGWIGAGLAFICGGAVIAVVGESNSLDLWGLATLRPWQLVFIAVGLPGLLFAGIAALIADPPRRNVELAPGKHMPIAGVVRFMLGRKTFYLAHFLGLGLYVAFGLGIAFWAIEYFVRTFGSDRSEISYVYGAQTFVMGSAGSLAAGWISDVLERHGMPNTKLRVVLASMCLLLPCALALPFLPNVTTGFMAVAAITFLLSFPAGPAIAALQIATPNEMRGFAIGLYLFVANSVAFAVGPVLIGVMTEHVLADPQQLGAALALTAACLVPPAILSIWICDMAYRQLLQGSKT